MRPPLLEPHPRIARLALVPPPAPVHHDAESVGSLPMNLFSLPAPLVLVLLAPLSAAHPAPTRTSTSRGASLPRPRGPPLPNPSLNATWIQRRKPAAAKRATQSKFVFAHIVQVGLGFEEIDGAEGASER